MPKPFSLARLILNPSAGRGRTANFAEKLVNQLGSLAHSIEIVYSKNAEDLKQLAATARRDLTVREISTITAIPLATCYKLVEKMASIGITPMVLFCVSRSDER